jgi:hypothetical protein
MNYERAEVGDLILKREVARARILVEARPDDSGRRLRCFKQICSRFIGPEGQPESSPGREPGVTAAERQSPGGAAEMARD